MGRFGGSRASECAVEAALKWFMRHQSPNGQWDVDGYPQNCTLPGPKCEPGTGHADDGGDGDTACTGYALLCFLGAGYDHDHPNRYRRVVQRGLDWLISAQNADGSFGSRGRNYENGVCTMALAEAYAMTNDPALREPAQKGVDNLLENQLQSDDGYPLAWNYKGPNPTRIDSSVSGWCVMALKSAKAGGLDVGDGLTGAKRWLEAAWKATNPDWADLEGGSETADESGFCYTWNPQSNEFKGSNRTCIGGLCAVFLGYRQGDVMLETMANWVMNHDFPDTQAYPTNTYYMYYNTLFIFQVGGERWKRWNDTVRDMLIDAQHANDDCFDGSWDWEGTKFHGSDTGRLLSTAYCCLSLEVYYRYLPVAAQR